MMEGVGPVWEGDADAMDRYYSRGKYHPDHKKNNFWCWLNGCKIVTSYDASSWCTRCGRDFYFYKGIFGKKRRKIEEVINALDGIRSGTQGRGPM